MESSKNSNLRTMHGSYDGTSDVNSDTLAKVHSTNSTPTLREAETQDASVSEGSDYVNLPYRTVTNDANMDEYLQETVSGQIAKTVTNTGGQTRKYELVTFTVDDPENPKNWSKKYKWYCTMVVALTCFVVAFNSAVITADIEGVAREFHVSQEVALLSVTVFVIGFGVGPMAFAPLSEIVGRRIIYAITLFVACLFVIPGAVAGNISTLLATRAIDGIAFSAPMTLVGGTLADIWTTEQRGVPMAAFSCAPFLGPAIGPLAGGYLSTLSWRWLYWIQLILSGFAWAFLTFTVPETYAPKILAQRAKKLRKAGASNSVTEQDLDDRSLSERLRIFLIRPFKLLFLEPIVFFISLYMAVLYGLLYMFFVAFPIVYQQGKSYTAGKTGLMFIPLAVGILFGGACSPLVNKHYLKLAAKYPHGAAPAELRLIPMMIACWLIPIGLFIFAWSSYSEISWAGPAIGGGLPVGFGFLFMYNAANNYLVDTYRHQAASALAAKTLVRSIWGACTVLFTGQMYARLGDQWASSLLAFIALTCCGIPYILFFFGARIRKLSKFAYSGDDEENQGKGPAEKSG